MKKLFLSMLIAAAGAAQSALADEAVTSAQPARKNATAQLRFSKVTGKVDSIDAAAGQLVVKEKGGKTFAVSIGERTRIYRNSEAGGLSQIKPGDRVSVRFDLSTKTARRVDAFVSGEESPRK